MQPWLSGNYANPSSIYKSAQVARAAIDQSRIEIARFLNCKVTEVFFTGSGTESCNWAIWGVIEARISEKKPVHLIISAIEHSAVLEMAKYMEKLFGVGLSILPVNSEGIVKIESLEKAIRPETVLVSVMMVNNEIGTVQPVKQFGKLCRSRGIYFHSDACQAVGFFDLNVNELNVDLLSLNAGKIYGPKGVGALYVREQVQINPMIVGGGQEFKIRAGTENVAGIVGFGKAVELIKFEETNNIHRLRDKLWGLLTEKMEGISINGSMEMRAPNNLNIYINGVDGETLVRRLDLLGIAISSGSACASGAVDPSHVLLALGLSNEEAKSSVRITLGKYTTDEEILFLSQKLTENVNDLRNK